MKDIGSKFIELTKYTRMRGRSDQDQGVAPPSLECVVSARREVPLPVPETVTRSGISLNKAISDRTSVRDYAPQAHPRLPHVGDIMIPTATFRLDNGMRFLVSEDHAVPAVAFGICTMAGVCDEPDNRRGIAHYLQHMMFRESRNFGPREHIRAVQRTGGNGNAYTAFDMTFYHEEVPSPDLEEIFELGADRFMR